jgi:hypothetical protein
MIICKKMPVGSPEVATPFAQRSSAHQPGSLAWRRETRPLYAADKIARFCPTDSKHNICSEWLSNVRSQSLSLYKFARKEKRNLVHMNMYDLYQ